MTAILLAISVLLPTAAGYALLNLICKGKRLEWTTSLALSYGLGTGLLSQWMYLFQHTGLKYDAVRIGIPVFIVALICAGMAVRIHTKTAPISRFEPLLKKENAWSPSASQSRWALALKRTLLILAIAFISFEIVYVCWRALSLPIHSWDAIATSAFKAKVFFFEASIPNPARLPHPSYPLHIPLIEAWIAFVLGSWDDLRVKIIFPLYFLSFLVIYNRVLRHYTDRNWALLGTVLLLSSNLLILHATIAYRDVCMLYYNCTALMLMLLWYTQKNDAFLWLSSLHVGFAAFTKLEGTGYLFIHTFLFLGLLASQRGGFKKKTLAQLLKFILPSFGIFLVFASTRFLQQIPVERHGFDFGLDDLNRLPVIVHRLTEMTFLGWNWNIVFFLLAASLAVHFGRIRRSSEVKFLLSALTLFFVFYLAVMLLTINFLALGGELYTLNLGRVLLHFFPLATLLIVFLNFPERHLKDSD